MPCIIGLRKRKVSQQVFWEKKGNQTSPSQHDRLPIRNNHSSTCGIVSKMAPNALNRSAMLFSTTSSRFTFENPTFKQYAANGEKVGIAAPLKFLRATEGAPDWVSIVERVNLWICYEARLSSLNLGLVKHIRYAQ